MGDSKKIFITFAPAFLQRIDAVAKEHGVSRSEFIRTAAIRYLKELGVRFIYEEERDQPGTGHIGFERNRPGDAPDHSRQDKGQEGLGK